MQTLREEFLSEAISQLDKLIEKVSASEGALNDVFLSESFRRIHSIKGTSQVFDLKTPAYLAHNIEDLLQSLRDGKVKQDQGFKAFLLEGFDHLRVILRDIRNQKKVLAPSEFIAKLQNLLSSNRESSDKTFPEVPDSLLAVLTQEEIDSLYAALEGGKLFYLIEVFIPPAELYQLKTIRDLLSGSGRIIAVSAANVAPSDRLGFHLYFVSEMDQVLLKELLGSSEARIVYPEMQTETSHTPDLRGALSQIVLSGGKAANLSGKKVKFEVEAPEKSIKGKRLNAVYEILLHLVRNAIDHAIESPNERVASNKTPHGNIKIIISESSDFLSISFTDDGRGIDEAKIRQKSPGPDTAQAELLDLIFAHGFTTKDSVSDYSGRGMGLDIVKQIIDSENGTAELFTEPGKGTSFIINLPNTPAT